MFFFNSFLDIYFVILIFEELIIGFQVLNKCLEFEGLQEWVLLGELNTYFASFVVERSFEFTFYNGIAYLAVSLHVVIAMGRRRQFVLTLPFKAKANLIRFRKPN